MCPDCYNCNKLMQVHTVTVLHHVCFRLARTSVLRRSWVSWTLIQRLGQGERGLRMRSLYNRLCSLHNVAFIKELE